MKTIQLAAATILFLSYTLALGQDAPVRFQCEATTQDAGSSQAGPFSVEINGTAVKVAGVDALDSNFSILRKNDAFYVFKNKKNQGGNINRSNGTVELYAVNAATHKMTVSIYGTCVKQ